MYNFTLSLISAVDVGGSLTPRPGRFTCWNYPVPIVQEAGRAPERVWTTAQKPQYIAKYAFHWLLKKKTVMREKSIVATYRLNGGSSGRAV
jgi:hypothetical protein